MYSMHSFYSEPEQLRHVKWHGKHLYAEASLKYFSGQSERHLFSYRYKPSHYKHLSSDYSTHF